jgi:ribonuclease HI
MAKKQPKFYVVWVGRNPGVYSTWDACQNEINGFAGAKYKSFGSRAAALAAFSDEADQHWGKKGNSTSSPSTPVIDRDALSGLGVDMTAWCVDAACKGNPGIMEYQGVDLESGVELFHMGPYAEGTVNIGEFLAIVHALALLNPETSPSDANDEEKRDRYRNTTIYSDSLIGIGWVKGGVCRTKLPKNDTNRRLFEFVARAERWLATHAFSNPILKWETSRWGEIPADFGRK